MHVAILGTYPPTQCGIATFTADVESSLRAIGVQVTVVPVVPRTITGDTSSVTRDDPRSYAAAATTLNASGCDVLLVQHEFGIFGGDDGAHVLELVERVDVPVVVTLHTVLQQFSPSQSAVIDRLCRRAAAVTVFTDSARQLLVEQELVTAGHTHVVVHGAPAALFERLGRDEARRQLGLEGDGPLLSTFGLLSPGKGIELVIHAMALLRSEHPALRYVVAGRTHPEVARRDGERYRMCLQALAADLGLADRVVFLDRFLEIEDVTALLVASDVVCTPYQGEDQTVSGVLTYALAAGRPIVSTPYRYARDVLADGAGMLAGFDDDEAFADAVHLLLDPVRGRQAQAAARRASARMPWPTVAAALVEVLERAVRIGHTAVEPRVLDPAAGDWRAATTMSLGTSHLHTLCDGTGVLQHARYRVPRPEHGYCVDDVGRMLPVLGRLASDGREWDTTIVALLDFLRAARPADGSGAMHNFLSYGRRWIDDPSVGDHVGRAMWGLGELAASGGTHADAAAELLVELAPSVSANWPIKTVAYGMLGLLAAAPHVDACETAIDRLLDTVGTWRPRAGRWAWYDDVLDYDHARVPEVLLRAGLYAGEQRLLDDGITLLSWLERLCQHGDHYRFPGHRGLADVKELSWSGDEQPLEAAAMADAQAARYAATGEQLAVEAVGRAWSWFLGNNRLGVSLVDVATGAGCDGLGARDVNRNCGAESTIAAHRCASTWRDVVTRAEHPNRTMANRTHPSRVGA